MADPRIRQIKIQTGVVKRLAKEKTVYEKEVEQTTAKIDKMKENGEDEYNIKKMGEVLQESVNMVPDTLKKLKEAHARLTALLQESSADLNETEEFKAASEMLSSTQAVVASA